MYSPFPGVAPVFLTVKISLEDPLLSGFHRRGRRKLKEIEEGIPDCHVKFEKANACLMVSGSLEAIEMVRFRVECMTGPRKRLSVATWAEMMRTRMSQDQGAIVAEIQRLTGCRLHIERGSAEVRLFGPDDSVAQADQMLDCFEAMCSETDLNVPITFLPNVNMEVLGRVAQDLCVSCQMTQDRMILIMGFEAAVTLAKPIMERYILEGGNHAPDSRIAQLVEEAVQMICAESGQTNLGDLDYEEAAELVEKWGQLAM